MPRSERGSQRKTFLAALKQSFSWWSFAGGIGEDRAAAEALVAAAAQIGYAGVEMPPEWLWPTIQAHGMAIPTIVGHPSIADGMNRAANHERIAGEIATNLEKATANGIPNLIVFSGSRAGQSDDAGADATVALLRRVAPWAESAGVTLLMELLNSRRDHPDYQADRTAWGVRVCRGADSPCARLLYDIYHMQIMEGDAIQTIRDNRDWIGHYHTAGVPGRHDLDDAQELNYPAIVRAIAETGYDSYLGHEFIPRGEPIAALGAAFQTCAAAVAVAVGDAR